MSVMKWVDRKTAIIVATERVVFDGLEVSSAISEILESEYVVNAASMTPLQFGHLSGTVKKAVERRKAAIDRAEETERFGTSEVLQPVESSREVIELPELPPYRSMAHRSPGIEYDCDPTGHLTEDEYNTCVLAAMDMEKDFIREAWSQQTPGNADLIRRMAFLLDFSTHNPTLSAAFARLYRLEKRYNTAMLLAERALDFHTDGFYHSEDETHIGMARGHYELAMIHHELGYYMAACENLRRVLEVTHFLRYDSSTRINPSKHELYPLETQYLRGRSMTMLAVILAHTGDFDSALAYATMSKELAKPEHIENREWFLARNAYTFGEIAFKREDYRKAITYYAEAHKFFEMLGDQYSVRQMTYNMALAQCRSGHPGYARDLAKTIEQDAFATDEERTKVRLLRAEIALHSDKKRAERLAVDIAETHDLPALIRAEAYLISCQASDDERWKFDARCVAYEILDRDADGESPRLIAEMKKRIADELVKPGATPQK